jgi:hypothetical protein
MAYIKKTKSGKSWGVHNGSNGRVIRRHQKRSAAQQDVMALHRKHKPKKRNRGKNAKRRFV